MSLWQRNPQDRQIPTGAIQNGGSGVNAAPPLLAGGSGCETAKPDTGSALGGWLTQCQDLHCDRTRPSFIFRSQPPAPDKGRNLAQVPPQACVTNMVRGGDLGSSRSPKASSTCRRWWNQLHSFSLQVGRNKQPQELAPFHTHKKKGCAAALGELVAWGRERACSVFRPPVNDYQTGMTHPTLSPSNVIADRKRPLGGSRQKPSQKPKVKIDWIKLIWGQADAFNIVTFPFPAPRATSLF